MWSTSERPLPEPWRSFLATLDRNLPQPVALHCLGGFALIFLYGAPRVTEDIDALEMVPNSAIEPVLGLMGRGSDVAKEFGIYLDYVRVATYPEDYERRLVPMYEDLFQQLRIFALDPYDLALCKIERNSRKDREDVKFLGVKIPLETAPLQERYDRELRPNLLNPRPCDLSLKLWIEMIEEERFGRS